MSKEMLNMDQCRTSLSGFKKPVEVSDIREEQDFLFQTRS
jgi:hypothetical protein